MQVLAAAQEEILDWRRGYAEMVLEDFHRRMREPAKPDTPLMHFLEGLFTVFKSLQHPVVGLEQDCASKKLSQSAVRESKQLSAPCSKHHDNLLFCNPCGNTYKPRNSLLCMLSS